MNEQQPELGVNSDHDRVGRQRPQRFREGPPTRGPRASAAGVERNRPENPAAWSAHDQLVERFDRHEHKLNRQLQQYPPSAVQPSWRDRRLDETLLS